MHSTYSYDGRHSLEELVAYALRQGFRFLAMSEHSETLDERRMEEYVRACQEASSVGCLLIPGIEFTCEDNLHLLGYGVTQYSRERDPVRVAQFIRSQGGVAVVAHPMRYGYRLPEGLESHVDGVEVWNARYDGRFLPDARALDLLNAVRGQQAGPHRFGGQDLHVIRALSEVTVSLAVERISTDTVLRALRKGEFAVRGRYWRLAARGEPHSVSRTLRALRELYERVRSRRHRAASRRADASR